MVRIRLEQFFPQDAHAQDVSKSTRTMLKTALMVYFSIWCGYPTLWILKEVKVIDAVTSHCIHVFLDVFSKSGPRRPSLPSVYRLLVTIETEFGSGSGSTAAQFTCTPI